MRLRITAVTADDEAGVDAALAVLNGALAEAAPDFPPHCRHRLRAGLCPPAGTQPEEHFVAWRDGVAAGHLMMELPARADHANVGLSVHPQHRRRGVGRALYQHALRRLRAAGRVRLTATTIEPLPGRAGPDPAGRAFATRLGATAALTDLRYRLDLASVEEAALAGLRAEADRAAPGYRLVAWRDRTPDRHVADAAYLATRVGTDAPTGDLAAAPDPLDVDQVRRTEADLRARRFRTYLVGALAPDSDRMVALTMLAQQHSTPEQCSQWITIVAPEHRGRRLGLLVKLANLAQIRAAVPKLRTVNAWNATGNHHMITVNERMGFQPVDSWVTWQRELPHRPTGGP